MAIDDGPVIVGGGPSGLAAAIELRRLGISPVTVIEREREAGGIPRHSDHSGFGLRDLRTVLSGPRYAAALPRAGRGGGRGGPGRDDGHRVGGGPRPEADRPARPLGARATRRRPRHGLPRAAPVRAPGPRLAARRGDDHRDPPAARPPARPEGRPARRDRRRRARQLLGGRHPRARRRLGRGPGHGAAPSPVAADLPGGRRRPLPGAGLDPHGGQRDPRLRAGRVGRAHGARLGPHPDGRMRPGHLHR